MLNLEELVGLKGKTVVITGAASGMAKTATELLISLGAKVYAVDRNAVDLPVEAVVLGDLSKKETIDDVVSKLPEKIDAVYLCAGVGLRPNCEKFIQMVNFVGTRYLAEQLLPRVVDEGSITVISSTGGYGWTQNMKVVNELLNTTSFEDAEKWIDEHIDMFASGEGPDPYQFSKQCLSAYVKQKARSTEYIGRKVRINAIGPSFTATPLIADFNKAVSKDGTEKSGEDEMYNLFLKSWNGRAGKPEEMGYPLVILGSQLCSYLSGQVVYIDFGMTAEMDYMAATQGI
jgi:NAD(P)-dependent dehydrogenase (short-subunit alcohol dehydrogenase family)